MSRVTLDAPWLEFDFGAKAQVLSWAIHRPGFTYARRILWREVRNSDLMPDLDVRAWAAQELSARGAQDAVLFLTSRNVTRFEDHSATAEGVSARCVATVGLSNGERVGRRVNCAGRDWDWGTINVAVQLSTGLTQTGLIEAMSIAVQARTAAVMDAGIALPTGLATGTGTDCVAIAAPDGAKDYAGLHTATGEAIGRAVYDAVHAGTQTWIIEDRERRNARP